VLATLPEIKDELAQAATFGVTAASSAATRC